MSFPKEFFSKDYFFGKTNSNYGDYDKWDNNRYWRTIISTVERHGIEGRSLDVGCAFGFLLKRLKPYFKEIHGVDISEFAITKAREEVPVAVLKIMNIEIEKLPYPDRYFDLITALDVLEHTESIEASLKKIIGKLKDNGFLIISMPFKDTLPGRLFHLIDKDASHISVLKRKELFNIINRVGLNILEKRYFSGAHYKPKFFPSNIEIVLQKSDQGVEI